MAECMIPELGPIPQFSVEPLAKEEFGDGILVRTPNWLGDACMAIPAILSLRTILPEYCGLFVLCPAPFVPLFQALPGIDKVVPVSDPHAFMTRSERKKTASLFPGLGILFNHSFRDAFSLKRCRIPKLYGADARCRKFLLERAFVFPPRKDFTLNLPHQAAKYLSIVQALGAAPWDGSFPVLRPDIYPETMPESLRNALLTDRPVLTVAAGAAYGSAKRWPTESFREVCRRKLAEGCRIVMTGSKGEREAAEEIIHGLDPEECFNLAGETDLNGLIWLLQHSAGCLANDSGVMHLAAVCGTPGVAPFGSTDPAATSPLSKKWRLLFEKRECSPCFKRVCPYGTKACFEPITPELVCRALTDVMEL